MITLVCGEFSILLRYYFWTFFFLFLFSGFLDLFLGLSLHKCMGVENSFEITGPSMYYITMRWSVTVWVFGSEICITENLHVL